MTTQIISLFSFFFLSTIVFSQKENNQIEFIDSLWKFTKSDTIIEDDGILINYYDSLSRNENFEIIFVGQDDLDRNLNFRRKQRVLSTGISYAIDFYKGQPYMGGYGNGNSKGCRTAFLQWHENGQLKLIINYLLTDETNGVKDGLSIWFDKKGKIEGYELFSNDNLIFKKIE